MTDPATVLRETFVELADTLVDDFDLIEFLDLLVFRCGDARGTLTMVAASDEQTRLLELFQLQNSEGPCLDCYRNAEPVFCPDLVRARGRWPKFS
ncbi:GAF domain-containing protein [Amycolatopsis alba]|uniref:GAF domain-containing protein n=1 Tax=Amycolatopsis alba TaxID=76020 RepID=UPI00037282DF|nr:GAF domain-containing protein [Amycolatopsis alba]